MSPTFKSDDSTSKKNYRAVSVLNVISKLIEKVINIQFVNYVDQHLSQYLYGCRKAYSTQCALLSFIEKWKSFKDKGGFFASTIINLSKAFDTISHDFFIPMDTRMV